MQTGDDGILREASRLSLGRGNFDQQVRGIGSDGEICCGLGDNNMAEALVVDIGLNHDDRSFLTSSPGGMGKSSKNNIAAL
jgi:hypothetical protein